MISSSISTNEHDCKNIGMWNLLSLNLDIIKNNFFNSWAITNNFMHFKICDIKLWKHGFQKGAMQVTESVKENGPSQAKTDFLHVGFIHQ
jgi:hypothetical protein